MPKIKQDQRKAINVNASIKVPVLLVKRMSDGPYGEMRWQIEVPDSMREQALALEMEKGNYFILHGSFKTENEISQAMNG